MTTYNGFQFFCLNGALSSEPEAILMLSCNILHSVIMDHEDKGGDNKGMAYEDKQNRLGNSVGAADSKGLNLVIT